MIEIFQSIADMFGAGETFRSHSHHVPRIARVLVVGGVGFIIQTTIFETLGIWLDVVTASTATLIGAECAIITNFFLNERFSFRDSIDATVPLYKRLLKFHLVASGSIATQWTFVFIAEHASHSIIVLNAAYVLGVGIGFIFSYTGYYLFVWRAKKQEG